MRSQALLPKKMNGIFLNIDLLCVHLHLLFRTMSQRNLFISKSIFSAISCVAVSALVSGIPAPQPAVAEQAAFTQKDIDTSKVVAVASPYGEGEHQLLVIQQISADKQCWSESGTDVKTVDPLLGTFDFTGICGRATDSNGYSIRMAGQDLGWRYSLIVTKRDGEMKLIGRPANRKMADLTIGRVQGLTPGFAKIELEPGWRITNRVFNGEVLGHYYFSHEQTVTAMSAQSSGSQTASKPASNVQAVSLK
ncbi:MAG: hypothetical protein RLZZ511_2651 [Cyanobacteriota bacterium]